MDEFIEDQAWIKKIKYLTQALIISGSLNFALLTTLVGIAFKNGSKKAQHSQPLVLAQKRLSFTSADSMEILAEYFELSYARLVEELSDKTLVEDGYAKRDLALACLVSYHYFDIQKALAGIPLQKRQIELVNKEGGERAKLDMIAGLHDEHFEAIKGFAKLEKWPFTPCGLHFFLKKIAKMDKVPRSLKEAFCMTPQFHRIWRLFQQAQRGVNGSELMEMMLSAEWDFIEKFYEELGQQKSFGENKVREFLTSLLFCKCETAAKILLHEDREFVLAKCDDSSILFLLSQLDKTVLKPEAFARQLLLSVRSEEVHHMAGKKLYELSGEKIPSPYKHELALLRFLPNFFQKSDFVMEAKKEAQAPLKIAKKYHQVVKGESLWRIASIYKVSVKELSQVNHLPPSGVIKPGMRLEIP